MRENNMSVSRVRGRNSSPDVKLGQSRRCFGKSIYMGVPVYVCSYIIISERDKMSQREVASERKRRHGRSKFRVCLQRLHCANLQKFEKCVGIIESGCARAVL